MNQSMYVGILTRHIQWYSRFFLTTYGYTLYCGCMYRAFSTLIILGLLVWGFLLWQRHGPNAMVPEYTGRVDNAEMADRCAQYRTEISRDGETVRGEDADISWMLGYGGRIRQLIHGCF